MSNDGGTRQTTEDVSSFVLPSPQPSAGKDRGAGRLIAGRYRLLAKLGHGGMGTVWRAQDETVEREVAVKEPRVPDYLPDRERTTAYERMRREARAAARLDHPAVVSVYDVAVVDGCPWIVMELVHGRSLGDVLRQEGALDTREAARIGLEVLGALEAAHAAGVLHRDVKPDNVLLGRHNRVVLADFGIAQIEGEATLTHTGAFVGSPEYIAPEQLLGQRPSPASDLWSLGVVLYTALEGVSPFRQDNVPATFQSVLSADPEPPASAEGPLAEVIAALLHKDPVHRPDTARVRALLETAVSPPALAPTRVLHTAEVHRRAKRRRFGRKAWIGLGAVVTAAAATAYLVLAHPFAGPLPDGWSWESALDAKVATPELFNEYSPDKANDKETKVTYADASGVIWITLERTRESEDSSHKIKSSAAAQVHADDKKFRSQGERTLGIPKGASTLPDDSMDYDGEPAAKNTVDFPVSDKVHPLTGGLPIIRELQIFYYRTYAGDLYRLTIGYPGSGEFESRGRQVAETSIANLKIENP